MSDSKLVQFEVQLNFENSIMCPVLYLCFQCSYYTLILDFAVTDVFMHSLSGSHDSTLLDCCIYIRGGFAWDRIYTVQQRNYFYIATAS